MTGYQYTVARVLDAQVEKVWRVWTQAEHYESWFHAVPRSVALDVRPGAPGAPRCPPPTAANTR